jgi:uncharacterized protein (TIGR00725 family)
MSTETDDEYIGAYESSKLIAQSGRLVINGGGPGVMYASTKGAKDGGGKVRVVYYTPKNATSFEGKAGLDIADEEFHEDNYIDRTQRLIEMGDAFVIFNGGTGTVSEFAMAWSIAKLYFGHHKPLIFYGAFWRNIMDAFWKNMKVREEEYRVFRYAVTPEQVMRHLEEYEVIMKNHVDDPNHKCEGAECSLFL